MLYIASDHGGFALKQHMVSYLKAKGEPVEDLGPHVYDENDDYPDFARLVAGKITGDPHALGILLCRSGQGMCITANKFGGVRAALAWNEQSAARSRNDDWANVLCLPSDYITNEQAERIVVSWLGSEPGKDPRFGRRVEKLISIENGKR